MPNHDNVSVHYTHGDLLGTIRSCVEAMGKTLQTVTVDDLAPVDEFHIGGRQASEAFLSQLDLSTNIHALDIGCGLGGASRFVASRFGARVTGIDLTPEYVETGRELCEWVGLHDRIALYQGSALAMSFGGAEFDAAYMMHVGMNIADKMALFSEVFRVLKPGAVFGIYDVMKTGSGDLSFPVPWATTSEASAVEPPEHYRNALGVAGFSISAERNRRDFALEFFQKLQAKAATMDGPPPLGLHILMGESAPIKVQNMIENIRANRVAPVELIAQKPRKSGK